VLLPVLAGAIALAVFVRHALRTTDALIDLRLFLNRTFTVSSITLTLVIISVFGGMLLLPLYLQVVRGESAMDTGLLLAPQGFGAMIAMPIAGRLTDRTGVGRIVPVGLILVALSFLGLTQLEADTSYWTFGGLLFVMGLGMGATMMPTFSGAMQTLRRAAIARASTTLNINQQVSASIGTAVLSVLLAKSSPTGSRAAGAASGTRPPCRPTSARRSPARWLRRSARRSGGRSRSSWSRSSSRRRCCPSRSPSRSRIPRRTRRARRPCSSTASRAGRTSGT
jgi:predicted MFS family arabinose efflux permease